MLQCYISGCNLTIILHVKTLTIIFSYVELRFYISYYTHARSPDDRIKVSGFAGLKKNAGNSAEVIPSSGQTLLSSPPLGQLILMLSESERKS